MVSELLSLLLWANATLSVGILIVFALRVPVRRLGGARIAYALWLLPLLAFLAWLAPARQVTVAEALPAVAGIGESAVTAAAPVVSTELLVIAGWLVGVGAMLAMFAARQRGFVRSAGALEPIAELGSGVFRAAPLHGPAVVGALRPMIVLPQDFGARFSAEEQKLVLAHERAHLDRLDPIVNAAALALRAINWFNPLVHVAARALRLDQELACDAAVLARHAGMHRVYAEAMLKSHAAAFDVPVGCAWHTAAFHPLKERILMLKSSPSRLSRGIGLSFVAAAAFGVCGAVWLMRPVEVLAAPHQEEQPLSELEAQAQAEAVLAEQEALDAMRDARAAARDAMREAKVAMREAMREAQAVTAMAQREAAVQAQSAAREARAAIAQAREAVQAAAPAIAAAKRAVKQAEPAIAAARREAELSVRRAAADLRRARALAAMHAQLASACRRAQARSADLGLSADEDLRALDKLVCIPRHLERPVAQ